MKCPIVSQFTCNKAFARLGSSCRGSYSWGILSDRSGRKFAFFATAIFTTVFGFLRLSCVLHLDFVDRGLSFFHLTVEYFLPSL
jgi:hypothetical protein